MYTVNEEKMFFDIADGQAVVINFVTGIYYGFTPLGSAVIEALVNGASEQTVLKALQARPNCPKDMEQDLHGFIGELTEKEILTGDGSGSGEEPVFEDSAFEEGFLLALQEFSDVQELLLADPVHEVDVDMGWPIMKEEA